MLTKSKNYLMEDVEYLLQRAKEIRASDRELADRYAKIAYLTITKNRLKMKREQKLLICKNCNRLLIPGDTSVVRLYKEAVTYKCLNCGKTVRISYAKRK
ncbi:MAG: ribonuclease P [Candidatus Parvarchaeota archaeon]|nr:ribonuclease P [Candidatus Parvarchaeota archaeon]